MAVRRGFSSVLGLLRANQCFIRRNVATGPYLKQQTGETSEEYIRDRNGMVFLWVYCKLAKFKVAMFVIAPEKALGKRKLRPLYLDVQATTPVVSFVYQASYRYTLLEFLACQDPRVLDAMLPYMVTQYGNPHSRTHAYGWESEEAVEKARKVDRTWSMCV